MQLSRLTTPWILRRAGYQRVIQYLQEAEANQWKSPEQIRRIQIQKLQALIRHAFDSVPHYRRWAQEKGMQAFSIESLSDLKQLPVLNKTRINENGVNDFIAEGVKKEHLKYKETSGSTGIPLVIYYDQNRADHSWAYNLRHNRWAGLDWGTKTATLWGTTPPYDPVPENLSGFSKFKMRLKDIIAGRNRGIHLDPYGMNEESMAQFARRFLEWKPEVIIGYANSLVFFAQFLQANPEYKLRPKSIISGGEMLMPPGQKLIEDVFQCRVYQRYGSREMDIIASSCEKGNLHVNDDNLVVEILEDDNSGSGRLVVTDLNNYAMPLIRYELGDLATSGSSGCSCGRGLSIISQLEGRKADLILRRDGQAVNGLWLAALNPPISGIRKYQVHQLDYEHFRILVAAENESSEMKEKVYSAFKDLLEAKVGQNLHIEIEYVDDIPHTHAGKYRYLISKVKDKESQESSPL